MHQITVIGAQIQDDGRNQKNDESNEPHFLVGKDGLFVIVVVGVWHIIEYL